jgi:hypothetical protein
MVRKKTKAMKKIITREYKKHFILNILPCSTNNEYATYYANADEVKQLNFWTRSLVRQLIAEPTHYKNIQLRADNLKKQGGALASLQTIEVPAHTSETKAPLVYLDLNYTVNKEVQLFIGGIDVTHTVSKSDKLTGLVTRFLKELYAGHEMQFGAESTDCFIEELYLLDDVQMVVDENNLFKLQVDRSLRDYLVALNSRLRVNA